jgi:magnesium transporter
MLTVLIKKACDEELKVVQEPITGSWLNVVDPDNYEIDLLIKHGIPKEFISSALDPNEQPRLDDEGGVKFVVLRVPHISEGDMETTTLGIILTETFLVTISKKKTRIIETFLNNPKGFFTTKRTRFLFQIFWATVHSYLAYLTHIDDIVKNLEKGVSRSVGNKEIWNLLEVEKSLTYFKTATWGNQRVLEKIMNGKFIRIYEQDEDILEDITIDNKQAIEMISTHVEIISGTMDAYASIVGNNLNAIMRLLTVFSIAFAIPTFIASLYGMNVHLPFDSHPLAFFGICIASVVSAIATGFVFSKIKI